MRPLAILAVMLASSALATTQLKGNTVVVDRPERLYRFFAGCTAVSVVEATQLHVSCRDGRVRSYELDEAGALLVNERQFEGADATLVVERGAVFVEVVRPDGTRHRALVEAAREGQSLLTEEERVTFPPREARLAPSPSPDSSTSRTPLRIPRPEPRGHAPTAVPRSVPGPTSPGARIAIEGFVQGGSLVTAGALGMLVGVVAGGFRVGYLEVIGGTTLGLAAGWALSPLILAPLHWALGGIGQLHHAYAWVLGSLAVFTLTALASPAPPPTSPAGLAFGVLAMIQSPRAVVLPLMALSALIGLEVGDAASGGARVVPTVSLSSAGGSIGVTGQF